MLKSLGLFLKDGSMILNVSETSLTTVSISSLEYTEILQLVAIMKKNLTSPKNGFTVKVCSEKDNNDSTTVTIDWSNTDI
jgi:hypothetical protein